MNCQRSKRKPGALRIVPCWLPNCLEVLTLYTERKKYVSFQLQILLYVGLGSLCVLGRSRALSDNNEIISNPLSLLVGMYRQLPELSIQLLYVGIQIVEKSGSIDLSSCT